MKGIGEARGAITVVNALPTGIGSAIGIDLRVRAEVLLEPARPSAPAPEVHPRSSATPLALEALRRASATFPADGLVPTRLELSSEIPAARGLKSSSAVASAIAAAVAHAAGHRPTPQAVAEVSARASRDAGLSATGAFDDALAGLTPGLVVTDNVHDQVVRLEPLDPSLEVGLWIPSRTHPSSPQALPAFRAEAAASHLAVEAVLAGDWPRAMDLNSELVERVMGYPSYAALRAEARHRGGLGAGASGLGPAFALVAKADILPGLLELLPTGDGEVRRVRLTRNAADAGGGRP